jgi:hypothetical protein
VPSGKALYNIDFGWLVRWLVGWLSDGLGISSVPWFFGWLVDSLFGWFLVCSLVGLLVVWWFGFFVSSLVR